ncbi:hypothetical protein FRB95_014227 [Tulasnella sp. JGI-2019a]|nr:hypothetical protein FRB95_014227 [Tulasnella sp. JGI-2019a]
MAPPTQTALARPPFAVDDKDTQYYSDNNTRPLRTRSKEERNKASESTYNAYDTYLEPGSKDTQKEKRKTRDSGYGAIGGGLLSALDDSDYSDDDDDDEADIRTAQPKPVAQSPSSSVTPSKEAVKSKNQALFEAATLEDQLPSPGGLSVTGGSSSRGPSPGPPAYEEVNGPRTPIQEKKKADGSFGVSNLTGDRDANSRGAQQQGGGASPNLHPDNHINAINASNAVETGGRRGPSPSITPPPAAPLQVHAQQMNAPQPQRPIPNPVHSHPHNIPPPLQQQHRGPPQQQPPHGMPHRGPAQPLTLDTRNVLPPVHHAPFAPAPGSMQPYGFHMTPTPTPADFASSPIVPAFIQNPNKPIRPAFIHFEKNLSESEKSPSAMSHESTMPIMRGEKEDYLPIRSNSTGVGRRAPKLGEKRDGDDFWRRFSMVAKIEKGAGARGGDKRSPWLKTAMGNTSSLRAWSWCIGLCFLTIIVGGIVAIWWFTRGNPAHQIPVAIGGGASETMTQTTTIPTPVGGATSTGEALAKAATTTTKKAAAASATSAAVMTSRTASTTKSKAAAKRTLGDFVLPIETPAPAPAPAPERIAMHRRQQQHLAGRLLRR